MCVCVFAMVLGCYFAKDDASLSGDEQVNLAQLLSSFAHRKVYSIYIYIYNSPKLRMPNHFYLGPREDTHQKLTNLMKDAISFRHTCSSYGLMTKGPQIYHKQIRRLLIDERHG